MRKPFPINSLQHLVASGSRKKASDPMRTTIRTSLILLAACLVSMSIAAPSQAQGRRFAVIVGINEYEDPTSFGTLQTCVADSIAMYDTLTKTCGYEPENVLLINDWGGREKPQNLNLEDFRALQQRLPTSANLRKSIPAWLKLADRADDTVMVFFSGHGIESAGKGVLATTDCRMNDLERTGLPTAELQEMLLACTAERKVLVLDCCHAGAAADKGANDITTSSEELTTIFQGAKGLVTLASCGPAEKSHQYLEMGVSVYTYFLTKGLQGEADNDPPGQAGYGVVDQEELQSYVADQVRKHMAREFAGITQTPKKFDKNSVGLFPLARVSVLDRGHTVNPEMVTNVPPKPGQEIEEAFDRLSKNRSKNPGEDTSMLIAEARKLRQPLIKDAVTVPRTDNPFFNTERAGLVANWLAVVSAMNEQTQLQLAPEQMVSLKTSQALAAWYKPSQDTALARKLVEELYPFDVTPEMQDVQAQLFLVHAETRDTSAEGQRQALDSYARILKLQQDYAKTSEDKLDARRLRSDVIDPALSVAARLGTSGDSQARVQVAAMHGVLGDLIERNPEIFPNDKSEGIDHLKQAIELDPNTALYPRAIAGLMLQMPQPDYAEVRTLAQQALQLSRDAENQIIANRLLGQGWMDSSRKLAQLDQRRQEVQNAIDAFSQGIAAYENIASANAATSLAADQHYVDTLVLRADAYKDQANFVLDFRGNSRREALDKAIADARKATTIDKRDQLKTRAFKALGNALEDSAWLAGKQSDYAEAAQAFRSAIANDKLNLNAQIHVDLARCLFKWDSEGNGAGHLDEAKAELDFVLNLFFDEVPRAHAHFWQAKLHIYLNDDLDAADDELRQAWDGMKNDNRVSKHDLSVCIGLRSQLARTRAQALMAKASMTSEDISKANELLGIADFSAGAMESVSPSASAVAQADVLQAYAQLLKAQGKTDDANKRLEKALGVYAKHLESSELSNAQRSALLIGRCGLIMSSDLKTADLQLETPQALADARKAAELANQEADFAAAKGWAGTVLYENCFARKISFNDLDKNPIYTTALSDLQEALKLAPEHKSAGRWSLIAGSILYIKVAVSRTKNQQLPIEVSREADRLLDQAAAKDPATAAEVRGLKAQLRRADPRLNG